MQVHFKRARVVHQQINGGHFHYQGASFFDATLNHIYNVVSMVQV